MTITNVQIQNIDASSLRAMFVRLENLLTEIKQHYRPKEPNEWLTRHEIAKLFKITLPTVHAWINKGLIKSYKIANKTRLKRSEIETALIAVERRGAIMKLIPIHTENGNSTVQAIDLYNFLEPKTAFRHWIKRMLDYGFIEGTDFAALQNVRRSKLNVKDQ